ncbi:hypothetical protein [Luteolibacter sp. Populi]|uniref:hypothetical protein n=1 Tax=Luteolibacter sp. Populi TaxID=3230487 RepID=UPI0034677537
MKFGSEIDFSDMLASGLGALILWVFVFFAAFWLGTTTGAAALAAGDLAEDGILNRDWFGGLFSKPREAILLWGLPGALGLAAFWLHFARLGGGGAIRWAVATGMFALIWVAMWVSRLDSGWFPATVAWTTCVLGIGMMATGLWFLRQWQTNRWAGELAMIRSENAARRMELKEEFGTDSAGADEMGPP